MDRDTDAGQTFEPPRAWSATSPDYLSPILPTIDPLSLADQPVPERRWIVPGWIPH